MELIFFVGIPASGKSTYAAQYRQKGYTVLSSDAIRDELTGGIPLEALPPKDHASLNARVFETIRRETAASLQRGQSVVVDATNLNRKRRISFLKQFQKFDCTRICHLFITPVPVCMERNALRSGAARVPDQAMHRMLCNFECPNYWEGWDEIIPAICPIPYEFPFVEIRNFPQDNPHHALTLDAHMDAAARYCAEYRSGPMLERVARCHDIGKLYTKAFCNSRGVPTEDAHYLGHDSYGAYLYLTQMCCGRQPAPEEFRQILYETNLINCHMRPLTAWSGSGTPSEKDLALFGEAFLADLLMLHRADRAAH